MIGDENQTLAEGAVASWHLPGRNFMPTVAETLGVRINIPYKDLTDHEKDIVLHGAKKQYPVDFRTSTGRVFHTDKTLYENAYEAVYDSLKSVKSERAIKKVNQFFHFSVCPVCHGTRLNPDLLSQLVGGANIAQVADLSLSKLRDWENQTKELLPSEMQAMANVLFQNLTETLHPLLELGLDYLTLSRSGNTLSTGELQRIQLAKTLRTQTTGVLYVLDEPSIGLHPDNIRGLIRVFKALIAQGNSLVVVDHEVDIIEAADWVIEVGPGSGDAGGEIIAEGTPEDLRHQASSLIGPFMSGTANIMHEKVPTSKNGKLLTTQVKVDHYFNLHDIDVKIPGNEITAVTGFSGAGKTSFIINSLVPAIMAKQQGRQLPKQIQFLKTKLSNVVTVDSKPIGKNSRSSLSTYTSIMDNLRRLFADLPESKKKHYGVAYFSYNNKQGACEHCGGVGTISLDIQYLPDMEEVCPYCHGTRYKDEIQKIHWRGYSLVDLLNLSVKQALEVFKDVPKIEKQLQLLDEIGLDYLHLGESTPSLSGGEAQRLKLVNHLNKKQEGTLFVFDEPSIGLHPNDVQTLLGVMNRLKQKGATIVLITHDLDLMANADYMIDLGPKGGSAGGKVMASGRPLELAQEPTSLTLKYLSKHFKKFTLI